MLLLLFFQIFFLTFNFRGPGVDCWCIGRCPAFVLCCAAVACCLMLAVLELEWRAGRGEIILEADDVETVSLEEVVTSLYSKNKRYVELG